MANQKGGVGKTTTAVCLGAALPGCVLVVDLDAQGNASSWLGAERPDEGLPSGQIPAEVEAGSVWAIPASRDLVAADRMLARQPAAEALLRDHLKGLRYDFCLIDCPPGLGVLTYNALVASGELLIPVETSYLPLEGVAGLLESVSRLAKLLRFRPPKVRILPCRVRPQRLDAEVIEVLRKHHGQQVTETVIHESAWLRRAPSEQKPITEYRRCRAADEFRALAKEIA